MIDAREIQDLAGELSLRPDIIEKDYVLGWLLAGIDHHADLSKSWAFKGGTCLKKVYFETYRFSEDLDFTITNPDHQDESFLVTALSGISEWIYDQCGIEIPADQLRFNVYENKRGGVSAEGRVYYRGPSMSRGSLPRIKLDLTVDEIVVLEPTRQRVAHPYSDEPPDGIHARCYSYAEVFGEKLRALGERGRPRDLYDVINLFRQPDALHVAEEVQRVLEAKCEFKGIPPTSLAQVEPHRAELEADWAAMLEHQLPSLPPFESFWNVLPAFFEWLERRIAAPVPAAFVRSPGEEVIRPSAGTIGRLGVPGRPLEAIRFAAANRLCVDLVYQGSTRRIEPYSLRRTADGNIVLHAERVDGQGHRTYRVDGIASAAITDQSFAPKYLIELTPSGPQSIPPTSPRPRSVSPTSRIGRTRTASTGPSYVYECNYCGKRFPRKKRDSKLRPHKDKSGYPCPGRAAFFAETKY